MFDGLKISSIVNNRTDKYFAFRGSLTTPPCSENVAWHVMADTLTLSNVQVKQNKFQDTFILDYLTTTRQLMIRIIINIIYHD